VKGVFGERGGRRGTEKRTRARKKLTHSRGPKGAPIFSKPCQGSLKEDEWTREDV